MKSVSYIYGHSAVKHMLKDIQPSETKQRMKSLIAVKKEMRLFCNNCLKPEEKGVGGKMSVCRQCKAVGIEVRYCGKVGHSFESQLHFIYCEQECQRMAWSVHKQECGKSLGPCPSFLYCRFSTDTVFTTPRYKFIVQ